MNQLPQVQKIEIDDILGKLPDANRVENTSISLKENQVILIVCQGFEDRSTEIVKHLPRDGVHTLIEIEYPTNPDENSVSIEKLQQIQSQKRTSVTYNASDFFKLICDEFDKIRDNLENGKEHQIVIDVSAMSSYVFFKVMEAAWVKNPEYKLCIFYAEANEYHPTKDKWDEFFKKIDQENDSIRIGEEYEKYSMQSEGVARVYESPIFPGPNQDLSATTLIAIPNFSFQRMKSMIALTNDKYNVNNSDIVWLLGSNDPNEAHIWRPEALKKLYSIEEAESIATDKYKAMLLRLEQIWSEKSEERHLLIASVGSKMQNLGLFLFLKSHPECGLIHCEPEKFLAKEYTHGVKAVHTIDFGRISNIKEQLESLGTLNFAWEESELLHNKNS